ncbi:MAG: lipoprotein-releasing ABC transporter permease subunit [Thermodesulfobacteriota bacterium]|nr:lipoprotein-releasing ABC transporter permease subunit [Thermodesulfobacteriota bacterium]
MNTPFEWFVGLRYLKTRRKQTFISIISVISIAGVAIGVMALIIVLSVMAGYEEDLKSKILGTNAHIIVLKYGESMNIDDFRALAPKITSVPEVVAATPFVFSQAMITSESGVMGVVIRGIELESAVNVISLGEIMEEGDLNTLTQEPGKEKSVSGIVVGKELAKNLGIFLGDEVQLVSPIGKISPVGMIPRIKSFKVTGIFFSGMYEYDSSLVYVSLHAAQNFLSMGSNITGIELRVVDIYRTNQISDRVATTIGFPYWTKDWTQMHRNLFSALKLEKIAMFIILVLIVLVAAFNIISTLIMVVMEKSKDIAIFKSVGANNLSIMKIFMFMGLFIGFVGTFIGSVLGYCITFALSKYQFIKLPSDVYYITSFPVKMGLSDFFLITSSAVVISFVATIYPAWQAARKDPVEILRYE